MVGVSGRKVREPPVTRKALVRAFVLCVLGGTAFDLPTNRVCAALNDDFVDRFGLETDFGHTDGDNVGASSELDEPRHANSSRGG